MIQKIIDGRTDLVVDFLDRKGDPNLTDQYGTPLIKWCAYYGDVTAIKSLVNQGAMLQELGENFDLNGAAFHGHWQLCQYLIEQGSDVNYMIPQNGESALHNCLCTANRPSTNFIIKLLVKHGANPNHATIPNKETGGFMRDAITYGETPLHRAAIFGNEETIQLLLDAGADKSKTDMNDISPIGWASWHLRPGNILKLLAHGPHRIHPLHVTRNQSDHGFGWGSGMYTNLLGKIHD